MTTWIYNDGGRAEAGYKGTSADCAVRAIAIAWDLPYKVIYDDLRYFLDCRDAGSPRNGISEDHLRLYLSERGFRYKAIKGEHVTLHRDELPKGKVIANMPGHVSAVIDGIVNDTFDPNRKKHQKLVGYWIAPERNRK